MVKIVDHGKRSNSSVLTVSMSIVVTCSPGVGPRLDVCELLDAAITRRGYRRATRQGRPKSRFASWPRA